MADFTTFQLKVNTGTQASPTWTAEANQGGAGVELRWSDQSNQGATASASWPAVLRPAAATNIPYLYAFSADTTSLGSQGGGTNVPVAFSNANYNQIQVSWDGVGTFASAPILTAYASTAHAAITRGTPSGDVLAGNTTDTGATQRSYLKANLYGSGATVQVPGAAPTNAPVITDGTTGALTPGSAAWLTNYQGLQGDNDYIQYGSTPTALTAQVLYAILALFTGPNMATGTYLPVVSVKYTYS